MKYISIPALFVLIFSTLPVAHAISAPDRTSIYEVCINIAHDDHKNLRRALFSGGLRMSTHFNIIKCSSAATEGEYVNVLKFAAAHNAVEIIPLIKRKAKPSKYLDIANDNDGVSARDYITSLPNGIGYLNLLLN